MRPDCLVCHTTQSGRPYAGGLGLQTAVRHTLYSTNITPDKDTGIGNYSDQDFLNACVHRGVRAATAARLYPAITVYILHPISATPTCVGDQDLFVQLAAGARDATFEHAVISIPISAGQ